MDLGKAIKRARGATTQDQLAALLPDVSQPQVSKWEKGKQAPSIQAIMAIEDALGRPRGWIFRAAGLVAEPVDVREAVASDPSLSDEARRVLVLAYETFSDALDAEQASGEQANPAT